MVRLRSGLPQNSQKFIAEKEFPQNSQNSQKFIAEKEFPQNSQNTQKFITEKKLPQRTLRGCTCLKCTNQ